MKALGLFGWLTTAFGVVACTEVILHLSEQTSGDAMIRFLASAGVVGLGVAIVRRVRRISRGPVSARDAERHVLHTARLHGGRVTATEVAAETPVPLAQATTVLEGLTRQGACRMAVAEAGVLVFEFPDLEAAMAPAADAGTTEARSEATEGATAAARAKRVGTTS